MTAALVLPMTGSAAALYTLTALAHATLIFRRGFERLASWSTRMAWTLHTAGLALLVTHTGRAPVYSLFEVSMFLAWLLFTPYVYLEYVHRNQSVGAVLAPVAAAVLVTALAAPRPAADPFPGVPPQQLLVWHVGMTLLGYLFFLAAFVAGALYLVQDRNLRRKAFGPIYHMLPSLEWLDRSAGRLVTVGFALLTLGVAAGISFARVTWGTFWHADPKVLFTLLLWLVYGGYLALRQVRCWGGRRAAWWSVAAGAAVLFNYVFINMASSSHRF